MARNERLIKIAQGARVTHEDATSLIDAFGDLDDHRSLSIALQAVPAVLHRVPAASARAIVDAVIAIIDRRPMESTHAAWAHAALAGAGIHAAHALPRLGSIGEAWSWKRPAIRRTLGSICIACFHSHDPEFEAVSYRGLAWADGPRAPRAEVLNWAEWGRPRLRAKVEAKVYITAYAGSVEERTSAWGAWRRAHPLLSPAESSGDES